MTYTEVEIEQVCDTGSGGTPSRAKQDLYFGGTIPWVKSGELRESIITQTEESLTEAGLNESAAKLLPKDALLVALYGATVGRVGILGIEAATNQAVCHIIPDTSRVDQRYLFHALRSKAPFWLSQRVGGGQPNISQGVIKKTKLPLPPLSEQKRIAEILDGAEALRSKRRAGLALLDELTQSIFLDMFGDPVTNPRGWDVRKLAEVSTFENGDRSSNYPSGDDIKTAGMLFLSTKNIVDRELDLTNSVYITTEKFKSLSRGKLRRMDLIITLRGTLGHCCIFECEYETAFINAQMMIIRPNSYVTSKFLHALLTTKQAKDLFLRIGHGGAVPQLTATQLSKLEFPIPPRNLQTMFDQKLSSLGSLDSFALRSLSEFDQLFASLQHRAFRGEL